ncbi:FUSC family protein [Variovorax sp. OV329]|uniref:FUSC family protein n=1 Tax=Variovorax sp. OV329 TaxID=1882825 RepID=UPI0008E078F7|nr:FUSC family protein [Variovorax sp. OV329]SFM93083.1 Fusaric acid resistance protein-like [Variovorax sp. OV329]
MTLAPLQLDLRRTTLFKGARIVASYGMAAVLALALARLLGLGPQERELTLMLAANMALWACVSEAGRSRLHGACLLVLLCVAFVLGAGSFAWLSGLLTHAGVVAPEFALLIGAAAVGGLRRFGSAGAGVGSQFYIGQMLAWSLGLRADHLALLLVAGLASVGAALLARGLLTEFIPPQAPAAPEPPGPDTLTAIEMGLQSGCGALLVLALDALVGLKEPAWAVTACVYVIAGSPAQTLARGRQRMVGTVVGVALGLAALPLVYRAPWLAWVGSAAAMMLYTTALAARYDLACGAFAFTLMVTLAAQGEHSLAVLAARAWETLLGAAIAMILARVLRVLRVRRAAGEAGP